MLRVICISVLATGLFSSMAHSQESWSDRIKVGGDFRFRHEWQDQGEFTDRHRQRIRARLKLTGQVNESTDVIFRLATGKDAQGATIRSNNQSLGDGGNDKSIFWDMAYFRLKASEALTIAGGKTNNPFYRPGKSQLLYDSDLTPEGAYLSYSSGSENLEWFTHLGGFWLDERKLESDAGLLGLQTGMKSEALALGLGYYAFTAVKGYEPIGGSFAGNTSTMVNGTSVYAEEFNVAQVFLSYSFGLGSLPTTFVVDSALNTSADEQSTAYLTGFSFGKTKEVNDLGFALYYLHIEKDAVLGILNNSDFSDGANNHAGIEASLKYQVAKDTTAVLTYYQSDLIEGESDSPYKRAHLDFKMKF